MPHSTERGRLIDGTALGRHFREAIASEVRELKQQHGVTPGLGVILVGGDPASKIYVNSKVKACQEVGVHSASIIEEGPVTTGDVLAMVESMNRREDIDGVLVQLPLPRGVDEQAVLQAVLPEKDVDGFHPFSLGKLVKGPIPNAPCTPTGIILSLRELGVPLEGANVVVVGRSIIVGKPMALLFLHENATVTVCHSKTRDLPAVCREADILVAAIGRPFMIDASYIKEGAVVVDVGVNRVDAAFMTAEAIAANSAHASNLKKRGTTVVGDVAFHEVRAKASYITPVPGGVGPLTIAMLLRSAVKLAKARRGISVSA